MSGRSEVYDEIVRISESLEKVRQELVPTMGQADTLEGETLRAFDRVVYRWFNDGDKYSENENDYGYITVRPSVVWLYRNPLTPDIKGAALIIRTTDEAGKTNEDYEHELLSLAKALEKVDWSKRTPYNVEGSR